MRLAGFLGPLFPPANAGQNNGPRGIGGIEALDGKTEELDGNTEELDGNTEALDGNTEAPDGNTEELDGNTEADAMSNQNLGCQPCEPRWPREPRRYRSEDKLSDEAKKRPNPRMLVT